MATKSKTTSSHKDNFQKLQEEIKTLDQNWKRALADYHNLVKRFEAEKQEVVRLASVNVVNKLLPTLDVLELAARHSQDQGVTMAVKQFRQVLKEEGLEEILPQTGDKFDSALHECVEVVKGMPGETVAEVSLTGYKINGFILRPAKVKVYKETN